MRTMGPSHPGVVWGLLVFSEPSGNLLGAFLPSGGAPQRLAL